MKEEFERKQLVQEEELHFERKKRPQDPMFGCQQMEKSFSCVYEDNKFLKIENEDNKDEEF